MEKKLYKDAKNKKICGVCAGLANYVSVDATLVRLGMVIFALCGGGILAYIICAIIMPDDPNNVIDAE